MSSPILHSVSGYIISKFLPLIKPASKVKKVWTVQMVYIIFITNVADLDLIPQLLTGEKYHRGLTHSLIFALLFSVVFCQFSYFLGYYLYKNLFLNTSILYISHLFLDCFTRGSKGIKLLWPFSDNFYRSPISFIPGVHYSRGLLDSVHILFISF